MCSCACQCYWRRDESPKPPANHGMYFRDYSVSFFTLCCWVVFSLLWAVLEGNLKTKTFLLHLLGQRVWPPAQIMLCTTNRSSDVPGSIMSQGPVPHPRLDGAPKTLMMEIPEGRQPREHHPRNLLPLGTSLELWNSKVPTNILLPGLLWVAEPLRHSWHCCCLSIVAFPRSFPLFVHRFPISTLKVPHGDPPQSLREV